MSLVEFARSELQRAGLFDEDSDYRGMLGTAVLKMIEQFADEGHSGFSARYALALFDKLAKYEPLSPLTGEDDEWTDVSGYGGDICWQNKRCGRVFKNADGRAYDMDGKVFRESSGACFTSRDSRVYVTFPYMPKTEYVDVEG